MSEVERLVQNIRDANGRWDELTELGRRSHYMGVELGHYTKEDLLAILAEYLEITQQREAQHRADMAFMGELKAGK